MLWIAPWIFSKVWTLVREAIGSRHVSVLRARRTKVFSHSIISLHTLLHTPRFHSIFNDHLCWQWFAYALSKLVLKWHTMLCLITFNVGRRISRNAYRLTPFHVWEEETWGQYQINIWYQYWYCYVPKQNRWTCSLLILRLNTYYTTLTKLLAVSAVLHCICLQLNLQIIIIGRVFEFLVT